MRNGNFTKTGIVCLALLVALGAMGVTYAQWSDTVFISGTVETGEFSSGFIACSTNDPPNTIDPGKDKDVGSATAELASPENDGWEEVVVTITNAYPCYQCQVYVTVQNHGTVPAQIDTVTITSPPEVTVTDIDALIGVVLDPGETVDGTVSVHLEQSAAQCHSYIFTIEIPGILWCLGGSQGMWKNWDNHYEAEEVNAWLQAIDTASPNHPDDWLVPELDGIPGISVGDLNEIYEAAKGAGHTKADQFLAHYVATRLNIESGTLSLGANYNVTSISGYGYLGLATPTSAALSEIIAAIESKYDTSPSDDEFTTMMDVCEALNDLLILPVP